MYTLLACDVKNTIYTQIFFYRRSFPHAGKNTRSPSRSFLRSNNSTFIFTQPVSKAHFYYLHAGKFSLGANNILTFI
jgi:hypothetical protein